MQFEIKDRIDNLRSELTRHNHNYYVLNSPEISDREFDMMLKELEILERENPEYFDPLSPTQRVGSDLSKGFEQVFHERPMMSLANTYSLEEVNEWFGRVRNGLGSEDFSIVGEMKFDGTSISLIYRKGELIRAVTRGDGTRGDDVTANVKTIRSIPLRLQPGNWPEEFEIRGEILMPWEIFETLNKERAYNEEPLFANPRNAASGTLKMQNSREVARRRLDVRFYYLLGDNLPTDSHFQNMKFAVEWGFKVSSAMRRMHSLEEVKQYVEYWNSERKSLPVATDGLVFKVDSMRQQLNLGRTAKSPRWAVAYKFEPERACTQLHFVSFETGRMGNVTPVANLEPVLLSGTIVKRASLHNEDIINSLDIHVGDWLYVEKGGEIIPKITGVDNSRRNKNAIRVKFVDRCPVCYTPLERREGEAAWFCPNRNGCRPQITGRIEHFASRRMMNIDGIGEETVELLYENELVKDVADLYKLTVSDLAPLERMGDKSAKKIIESIENSKKIPFERVIYALSIPNVGETTSKRIAKAAVTMDRLISMSVEELTDIPDVGPVIALCIKNFFSDERNRNTIERLCDAGVCMTLSEDKMVSESGIFEGKTIVISGTFSKHSRDEYKDIIEHFGGKNSSSISKKTDFVLAGENMGPAKLDKCVKLGIRIVNEDEFLTMIGE